MNSATRMRKLRARRALGLRVLRVEVNIDTVETLIELDYLSVESVHNLDAVASALSNFIEDSTEAVTGHGITLNSW